MTCFAVTQHSRVPTSEAILLLVDDRGEADEIAAELGRKGFPAEVHEINVPVTPVGGRSTSASGG